MITTDSVLVSYYTIVLYSIMLHGRNDEGVGMVHDKISPAMIFPHHDMTALDG